MHHFQYAFLLLKVISPLNIFQIRLVRIDDGHVMAWYTMHDPIQSLTISANGWYILIGTTDRRLFILLIVDPDRPEHRERIKHVRKCNPPLDEEDAYELLDEIYHKISGQGK